MFLNIKQIIFLSYLFFFFNISALRLKMQTKSEGCSISLKKVPHNKVQAVSFISEMQDGLYDFDACKSLII